MAYVVSALWTAKQGEEDRIARICGEMTAPSRDEPGNLFYQAHQDSEHFQRLVVDEAIPNLESRERAFYETMFDDRGGLA